MQTRSDQYTAYRYLIRRVLTSMTGDSPDSPEQPFRRLLIGTFAGILVMLVAGVVVALVAYAAKGGNDEWYQLADAKTGKIVVEKDSSTLYVLMPPPSSSGGRRPELRPMENYPSALLVLANPAPVRESVGQHAIQSAAEGKRIVPGPPIGIPGGPRSLPPAENLVHRGRSFRAAVCSRAPAGHPVDVIFPKEQRFKHAESASGAPVFVRTSGGRDFMVYQGKKFEVNPKGMRALGYDREPITVGSAWINALPDGEGVDGLVPEARGAPVYDVGRPVAVGQILVERNGTGPDRFLLVDRTKLRGISEVQAHLLRADGLARDTSGRVRQPGAELTVIDTAAVNRVGPEPVDPGDLPDRPMKPVTVVEPDRTSLCAWLDGTGDPARTEITYGGRLPSPDRASASGRSGAPNAAVLADNTIVPAGSGAVVAGVAPNGRVAAYWLITGDGRKYAMPRVPDDAVAFLGYGKVKALRLPSNILEVIPSGPELSPGAARCPDNPTHPACRPAR